MKRIFFALLMCILLLPMARQANSAEVSIDFFYNNLNGGGWIEVADYGYCWQPDVAVNDPNWRPYSDGYWAYTDVGWTWISYEDFGWATYHYGRWAKLADYGWVWVPGSDLEWGPAWVSWRTGGDYVGWAPLPPPGLGIVYEGRPIGPQVDIEFDIGPAYYNFVDVRYIGEPVLRERIVDVRQNVTYINQTVNVTNITVNNNTVYNYGPDINVINQHSSRPIQRLRLERQENVDVSAAARSGGLTKVQGNSLVVAAPRKINKPPQPVAPPTVKAKVSQAKIEKGWSGVDPNTQAQIKQKIKTEDHTKIPPPTGAAAAGQAAGGKLPATSAAPTASPNIAASPFEKGRHKGKPGEQGPTGVTGSPAGALASPATTPMVPERGKHKGKPGEQGPTGATGSPAGASASPATTPMVPERGKHKGKHGEMQTSPVESVGTPSGAPSVAPEGTPPTGGGKHKGQQFERGNVNPTPGGAGENLNQQGQGQHKGRLEYSPAPAGGPSGPNETLKESRGQHKHVEEATGAPPSVQGGPYTPAPGGKYKAEGVNVPPSGTPAGAGVGAGRGEGQHEGKKKGEKESPTPGPQ